MKVLVGVDGSDGSLAAVDVVARLINSTTDRVALYYTPPEIRPRAGTSADKGMVERAQKALADAVFEEASARLSGFVKDGVHTIVGDTHPRAGLIDAAKHWKADMIALGATGGGHVSDMLLGSVASYVAHTSTRPVLVARQRQDKDAAETCRVLVAYDGSAAGEPILTVVKSISWPEGTVGRLMEVVEPLHVGEIPQWLEDKARDADSEAMAQAWERQHERDVAAVYDDLRNHVRDLPAAFQHKPIVAEGYPAEEIVHAARQEGIDLIVVGAHGKSAWQRWLLGSTSEKVLSLAPCSVLIVREK